jgi:hypothetical protein
MGGPIPPQLRAILDSSSYRLAEDDGDFLESDGARAVRLAPRIPSHRNLSAGVRHREHRRRVRQCAHSRARVRPRASAVASLRRSATLRL